MVGDKSQETQQLGSDRRVASDAAEPARGLEVTTNEYFMELFHVAYPLMIQLNQHPTPAIMSARLERQMVWREMGSYMP